MNKYLLISLLITITLLTPFNTSAISKASAVGALTTILGGGATIGLLRQKAELSSKLKATKDKKEQATLEKKIKTINNWLWLAGSTTTISSLTTALNILASGKTPTVNKQNPPRPHLAHTTTSNTGALQTEQDVTAQLLPTPSNPDRVVDKWGNSLLHIAARDNNVALINELIRLKATIDQKNIHGYTPLEAVAQFGKYKEAIEALIDAGANLSADFSYGTNSPRPYLSLAASEGWLNIAKKLIAKGASAKKTEELYLQPPLHSAIKSIQGSNKQELIDLLIPISNLESQDQKGLTALGVALQYKNIEAVRKLLEAGASHKIQTTDLRDEKNYSPICFAIQYLPDAVPLLLKYKVPVDNTCQAEDGPDQYYFNHDEAVIMATRKNLPAILNQLIAAGADVNIIDPFGETPLMLAVKHNSLEMVEALIRAGANLDTVSTSNLDLGCTALHYAVEYDASPSIIRALILAGANTEIRTDQASGGHRAYDLASRPNDSLYRESADKKEERIKAFDEAILEKKHLSETRAAFINAAARGQILWRQRNP